MVTMCVVMVLLCVCVCVCVCFQEAYSVARQFNLIPPICEQAEYHMFQREKVEVQLPELYHKIGERPENGPTAVEQGIVMLSRHMFI